MLIPSTQNSLWQAPDPPLVKVKSWELVDVFLLMWHQLLWFLEGNRRHDCNEMLALASIETKKNLIWDVRRSENNRVSAFPNMPQKGSIPYVPRYASTRKQVR
ncbi:hypothetical protein V6N11_039256 [Hibiscus sabdariffa]|uniref:Uncharacterized protein n=1 Tax=Hibiscus sabdariffa TaxID=183260 RepID=A0ABR2SMC7_9ROSI